MSELERKGLGEGIELNEKTLSYTKNSAIIYLLKILNSKKIDFNLFNYLDKIGRIFKEFYFTTYTKEIISNNYLCNFAALEDIFVREFYLSFYHLVDTNEEYSQTMFYSAFAPLSKEAEVKAKDMSLGSKPYIFENFIKETSSKRLKEPNRSYDFARELKNEATSFYNWFSEFYGFGNLVSKSLSDKIGNEILECSIAYYNAASPKTIEVAKESLNLMVWASDFAFNQALRDRINQNISILLNAHPNTEYKIVDFGFKDRTRRTRSGTPTDRSADTKTNNVPTQKDNTSSKKENKDKSHANTDSPITTPINKPNKELPIFYKLIKYLFAYFWPIFIVIIMLFAVFSSENIKDTSSDDNQLGKTKSTPNKIENYSVPKGGTKWAGNKLRNGDSPYDGYFGKGVYDFNSQCYLTFKNGNLTDAIVCLENVTTGRTIRNEYIRAGTNYQMTNIPEGIYKVKSFYGNDWNPEKTLPQGSIKGAFDTDLGFSISDNSDDLIHMNITKTGTSIRYTTGEITLYTVSNGNMNQRNINSDEFFK